MDDRLFYCGVALLSACSWAFGAILWARLSEQLSSFSMNLAKTVLGSLCLGFVLFFVGFEPISLRSVLFLGLSGILGIAIGDTFFFLALKELGPRRASLMGSLNPVAIAIAAALLLGERPSSLTWAGIVATTFGVGWVLWERASTSYGEEVVSPDKKNYLAGLRYGLLSVLCTSGAVLLAKVGIVSVPPVHGAWIRLLAGSAALVFWGASCSNLGRALEPFRKGELVGKVLVVVLIVVFGGFWLSLVALKHIDASLAGPLNSTAPLFILPMSVVLMKQKLSLRSIFGTAIAVVGVGLILRG